MELFGITLLGVNAETGRRVVLTVAILVIAVLVRAVLGAGTRAALKDGHPRAWFWARQAVSVVVVVFGTLATLSVWFDDTANLTSFIGLFTAGVAFALQKVITSAAGYVLILRGRNFQLGDRIQMGGVRGDVISLGFLQTTIMEMGQTPQEQGDAPSMWVNGRQFTGRVVTVSNSAVFDEPVYNYTRQFPFIWEELVLPFRYGVDRRRIEQMLLDIAKQHVAEVAGEAAKALHAMQDRYYLPDAQFEPRVYVRLNERYVQLALRFLTPDRDNREIKDRMSREVLDRLDEAGIAIGAAG
jgi:small-conductance mechanosensitive channel